MNRSSFLTLLATCVCGIASLGADDGQSLRRVYVPIKDLETVFGGHRQGVLLPDHEFEDLYEAARRNAAERGNAPAGAILTRADYDCNIDGEQLLVRVTGELKQFDRGWQQLTLPVGGLSLEAMTVAGQPAQVARHPEQADLLLLYVQEAGTHPVSAEFSAPLAAVGSDKAAGFQLFGAPSGRLGITLPSGKYLTFGGRQIERPTPADQEAVYSLPIGGLSDLQLRITEQQSQATGDALTFAQTAFGVYVAPGEVTWTAQTSLQVYGRTIDRLVCTVPNSLEITDVQSSGLDNWELADAEGDRTSITLAYRQPFDGIRQITFRGVVRTDAQAPWSVPDLRIPSLTSHVGRVVVQHPPGVRLQLVESSVVRPVLAGAAENLFSLQYEVWEEDFALAFTTSAKEREVHAAMTNLLDVNAEGLDLYVTVDVRTLFAPLFDVRLQLPAEWTVTAASVAGASVTWETVSPQAGMIEVRLPLAPTLAIGESRQVVLTAHRDLESWPVEQDPVQFAIPEVRLPQAGVVEALYGITVDDDLDALPIDVTGLDPARADDVAQLDQQMSALGRKLRLGYAYQDTVFSGQLQISRKPSRVSAATIAFFRIDPESLFGHLEAHLNIEGGGVRVLQVAVSETAGTDLRFQLLRPIHALPAGRHVQLTPVRIVEQQPADPADGKRIWMLQLDRRARGPLVLLADVQTPREDEETFAPFSLEVLSADRQSGHLAIEAGNDQQVTVEATDADGAALTAVDVVDFPPAYYRPAERIVAGFQFVRPGWQMTVSETRFDRNPVPTAVIHAARLSSVLGKAGEFQHQADVEFTAVGVQNLKVQLPIDATGPATLWAVLVDGTPVEARKADDGVLITLPQVEQPEVRRSLRLMYRTFVDPLGSWSGRILQTPPQISVVTGTGDTQPVDVLQQSWTIHHPPETLLVDSDGRFHPDGGLDRDSLLGRIAQWFRAPSPRDLWRTASPWRS